MKKIRCSMDFDDYLVVDSDEQYAFITIQCSNRSADIALSPSKIRKLRKQLKRALLEIEGEKKEDDWFSVGRTVKIIANTSDHEFPIGVNVRLVEESHESMRAEYLDGHDYWWVRKNDCEPAL